MKETTQSMARYGKRQTGRLTGEREGRADAIRDAMRRGRGKVLGQGKKGVDLRAIADRVEAWESENKR